MPRQIRAARALRLVRVSSYGPRTKVPVDTVAGLTSINMFMTNSVSRFEIYGEEPGQAGRLLPPAIAAHKKCIAIHNS